MKYTGHERTSTVAGPGVATFIETETRMVVAGPGWGDGELGKGPRIQLGKMEGPLMGGRGGCPAA